MKKQQNVLYKVDEGQNVIKKMQNVLHKAVEGQNEIEKTVKCPS
nr:hypothetical protein [Neobacillus sp. Marseille-Q6967]